MSNTLQRLTDKQALYAVDVYGTAYPIAGYVTGWTTTNCIVSLSNENYFINNRYVMTVIPQTSAPVVLECDVTSGLRDKDVEQDFVFTATLKFIHPGTVIDVELFTDIDNPGIIEKTATAGLWQVVRSELVTIAEEYSSLTARLTIRNHGGQPFYFTMPNVYNDTSFLNSPLTLTMKTFMPDFYWEYDSQSKNPHFPLFKFIDAAFGGMNDAIQMYADWFEYELSELPYSVPRSQANTKSRLLNPDTFYFEYLEWIWQFIGAKIKKNIYNQTTNSPLVADEEEFIRWQVRTSSFGRGAGTRQALREAVQFVLGGNKFVAITPNLGGNAFVIGIRTLVSETPDGIVGESSEAVLAAAESARPVGYQLEHEAVEFVTFILDDIENGRLDNAQIVDPPTP